MARALSFGSPVSHSGVGGMYVDVGDDSVRPQDSV